MSYSKVISFPEPPKAFTVGFVGDPPVPAGDVAENSRIALEQGKSETAAFYQEEIRKLRSEYGQRQKDLLSATQAKVDGVLAELDHRLPDLVIGLAERVLGQTPLDRETVEAIVKNMVAEFSNDDEKLEEVWNSEKSLSDLVDPKHFKSYDELKTRLDTVLAGTVSVGNVTNVMEDEPVETTVTVDTKESPAPTVNISDDEEDDSVDYFQKLADEG